MYAAYFGLREPTFNNTPDPAFFFRTPEHEEALATLVYVVNDLKGYVLLTGEVGTGKTMVTRLMLRHFGDRVASAVINNTCVGSDDLLATICAEFELQVPRSATRFELLRTLQDYLLAEFAANRPVVLVLDEAQNLPHEAFEQLRMVGNLEADNAKLLQVVIAGQPELRERFTAPGMRQFKQRLFCAVNLEALTREQCRDYILHRLRTAADPHRIIGDEPGCVAKIEGIFTDEAIELIHRFSDGLPRLINTVCENTLLTAYSEDKRRVDAALTRRVLEQISPGLAWTNATPAADTDAAVESVQADSVLECRLKQLERRLDRIIGNPPHSATSVTGAADIAEAETAQAAGMTTRVESRPVEPVPTITTPQEPPAATPETPAMPAQPERAAAEHEFDDSTGIAATSDADVMNRLLDEPVADYVAPIDAEPQAHTQQANTQQEHTQHASRWSPDETGSQRSTEAIEQNQGQVVDILAARDRLNELVYATRRQMEMRRLARKSRCSIDAVRDLIRNDTGQGDASAPTNDFVAPRTASATDGRPTSTHRLSQVVTELADTVGAA